MIIDYLVRLICRLHPASLLEAKITWLRHLAGQFMGLLREVSIQMKPELRKREDMVQQILGDAHDFQSYNWKCAHPTEANTFTKFLIQYYELARRVIWFTTDGLRCTIHLCHRPLNFSEQSTIVTYTFYFVHYLGFRELHCNIGSWNTPSRVLCRDDMRWK